MGHEKHIGTRLVHVKKVRYAFLRDGRRKGSERLSIFYFDIHNALCVHATGITEDASCPQCAWAEFHASRHVSDNLALCNLLRYDGGPRLGIEFSVGITLVIKILLDFTHGESGAEICPPWPFIA